jgi:hypothetical protein
MLERGDNKLEVDSSLRIASRGTNDDDECRLWVGFTARLSHGCVVAVRKSGVRRGRPRPTHTAALLDASLSHPTYYTARSLMIQRCVSGQYIVDRPSVRDGRSRKWRDRPVTPSYSAPSNAVDRLRSISPPLALVVDACQRHARRPVPPLSLATVTRQKLPVPFLSCVQKALTQRTGQQP